MDVMGILKEEQSQIFKILAGILNLGNITFIPHQDGCAIADKAGKI